VYYGNNKDNTKKLFVKGKIRILVVCGKLLEGFDHKYVSVCGIARKISPKSKVLFAQFVGRCMRKIDTNDTVSAKVISHIIYKQKNNYDAMDFIAEEDPVSDDEC